MKEAELIWEGDVEVRVDDEPFAVPDDLRGRVEELWEQELQRRPHLTDGSILTVRAVENGLVRTQRVNYRLFVARERDPALRDALQIRAIGVSGVLVLETAAGPVVVVGRRAGDVTEYPGAWELVPSGSIDPRGAPAVAVVDALGDLLTELEEETGISRAAVVDAHSLGLVHDVAQDGYDVCFALRVEAADVADLPEYQEVAVIAPLDAETLFGEPHERVVPTSRVILEVARRVGLV